MKINGVISNWHFNDNRIHGNCIMRDNYENGIEVGQPICTSQVNTIWVKDGKRYASTRNSVYLLID